MYIFSIQALIPHHSYLHLNLYVCFSADRSVISLRGDPSVLIIFPIFDVNLFASPGSVSRWRTFCHGPGDQSEPGSHAVRHWLWFLWQPQDQRHVLRLPQGAPVETEQRRRQLSEPDR